MNSEKDEVLICVFKPGITFLLMGCFQLCVKISFLHLIKNPGGSFLHFINVSRLGRAMSEAKDRPLLEQKILSMITDNELDDYNRLGMHYLFLHYIYYLDTKEERVAGIQKLSAADKQLPPYLISKVQFNVEDIEEGASE